MPASRTARLTRTDVAALQWFRDALMSGEAQERRQAAGFSVRGVARIVGAPTHGTLRRWEARMVAPMASPLAARTARFYLALPQAAD